MAKILNGGCLCGAVRYEYAGELGKSSYCHCDDCKRATGGPYTVGVLSKADKLCIVSGNVKGYTTLGDSGNKITRQFCPECGSPLFTRAELYPDLVFIKAGSLDEPELIEPSYQTWIEREVPWAHIDPTLPAYPKNGSAPKENDA